MTFKISSKIAKASQANLTIKASNLANITTNTNSNQVDINANKISNINTNKISNINTSKIDTIINSEIAQIENLITTHGVNFGTLEETVSERDRNLQSTARNAALGSNKGWGWGDVVCSIATDGARATFGAIGGIIGFHFGGPAGAVVGGGAGAKAGGTIMGKVCNTSMNKRAAAKAEEEAKKAAAAQAEAEKKAEEEAKKAAAQKKKEEEAKKAAAAQKKKEEEDKKTAEAKKKEEEDKKAAEKTSGKKKSNGMDNPLDDNSGHDEGDNTGNDLDSIDSDINYGPDGQRRGTTNQYDYLIGFRGDIDHGPDGKATQYTGGKFDFLADFDPTINYGQDGKQSGKPQSKLIDILEDIDPTFFETLRSEMGDRKSTAATIGIDFNDDSITLIATDF